MCVVSLCYEFVNWAHKLCPLFGRERRGLLACAGAVRPAGKALAENAEPAADQVDAAVIQPAKEITAQVCRRCAGWGCLPVLPSTGRLCGKWEVNACHEPIRMLVTERPLCYAAYSNVVLCRLLLAMRVMRLACLTRRFTPLSRPAQLPLLFVSTWGAGIGRRSR